MERNECSIIPSYVRTIRDEIYYECAKIVSLSLHGEIMHAFVREKVKQLRDGRCFISHLVRELDDHTGHLNCVWCGTRTYLMNDYLIPRKRGGDTSPDNTVLTCTSCVEKRAKRGVFEWLGIHIKESRLFPVIVQYLNVLLHFHAANGTSEVAKEDIDVLCVACTLGKLCRENRMILKLNCLCLESVLVP